jgi:tricorn protease
MRFSPLAAGCALAFHSFAQSPAEADAPSLFRNPSISATQVVFEYANDLWIAPRAGGPANRLTSGLGAETNPIFSPDGSKIAFTGQYDGSVDVFVVNASGGVPKRLTWHPGFDLAVAWTPDSQRVVFSSDRQANTTRYSQLFTISIDGGPESLIPLPTAFEAAYSPDAKRLAYVPIDRAFNVWKRYRGGKTTPIWIADLATSKVERVPRENSNDFCPMWTGNKVWFLSDREGITTLFNYDPQSKKVARAVENKGLDFKSASAAADAIVVEQMGALHLFDLKSGKLNPLKVTVSGDVAEVREKFARVGNRLSNAGISPTGARAVFEGRGEILTVPAEKGEVRNLTNSTGVMDRDPAWSPNGRWIAYFSDAAGEYDLHLSPQDGKGEVKRIRIEDKPTYYSDPVWSPDSKNIAFTDAHLNVWVTEIESGKSTKVDKDRYWGPSGSPTPKHCATTWARCSFTASPKQKAPRSQTA